MHPWTLSILGLILTSHVLAADKIIIEIRQKNSGMEVLSEDFFVERARPPQLSMTRRGDFRYVGESSSISASQRQAWIKACSQKEGGLRDCFKQMQRNAIVR